MPAVDVDFLTESFGSVPKVAAPPVTPTAGPDLDFLSQSFLAAPSTPQLQLRQEKAALEPEARVADIASRFDPAGTFFRGLRATGDVLAGAGEDVALGLASPWTGQPPSLENLRSALTTYDPTPAEKALAKEPGLLAGLTSGLVGAVKTAPTLAAGAAITAVTKITPEVVYPALFGGETYERTGDVLQSAKAATVGLAYPILGRAVKPLAAALINRLGVVSSPVAQKAIETTVDQGLMQAFTHVISLPEYAQMTPEQRERAIAENTGNILVFALPRVVGYAAGHPSEYEAAIRQESARLTDYFAQQREQEFGREREAAMGPRLFPETPGTTPARRSAAAFAAEQGIPVGTKPAEPVIPAPEQAAPTIGDLQIAIRLPSGEVISDPAARLHSDLVASKGITPEQISDPATDFGFVAKGKYYTKDEALSSLKRDDIQGAAGLQQALAEGTITPATPLGGPSASTIPSDQTKPAEAGQVGKGGKTDSGSDVEQRPPEQPGGTVQPRTEETPRLTLRNNAAIELPEFTLEAMVRGRDDPHTGRTLSSAVIFNPRDKGFIFIKGYGAKRATYRIPLTEIPHEIVKGGINIDKAAVLAFLNDKAKRQAALIDDRNVVHYASEDIDVIQKPLGRPATGAGTPLQTVPLQDLPKVQKKVGQPVSTRRQMLDITRQAFNELRAKNPQLIEQLLGRRPEELDDVFWNGIRDELAKYDWVASKENPLAVAEALVASLRRLKEGGDLEWQLALGPTGGPGEIGIPTFDLGRGTSSMLSLKMREFDVGRYEKWLQRAKGLSETEARIQSAKVLSELNDWTSKQKPPSQETVEAVVENAHVQEAANLTEARKLVDDPNNGLSEEARAVLRDVLDGPVGQYLNGRQIRFRLVDRLRGEAEGTGGLYSPAQQLIVITRGTDPLIGAHEFFHPLWEMIQDSDRANVKQWREQAIEKAWEKEGSPTDDRQWPYAKLLEREYSAKDFMEEGLPRELYHLSSTEEFFAWMMTERFGKDRQGIWGQSKEIWSSQDAFLSRVRQIISVIFDAIRQRLPGLRTQADILQRTILSGKYDFLPPSGNIPGERLITSNAVVTAPGVRPKAAITAHHGTPHEVGRFTTERIGTGEGAQVYGWGLYMAERPEVAETYRKASTYDYNRIRERLEKAVPGIDPNEYHRLSNRSIWPSDAAHEAAIREFEARHGVDLGDLTGKVYTVRLDVHQNDLLDWDKPLNQQSEKVKTALAAGIGGLAPYFTAIATRDTSIYQPTGHDIYRTLQSTQPVFKSSDPMKVASEYLLSLGIPGIKYLDQGSRNLARAHVSETLDGKFQIAGVDDFKVFGSRDEAQRYVDKWNAEHPPTSNFVIFDESKIRITHRNGQEVPLREAMGEPRGHQAALESREKVEEYLSPLEPITTPEKFRAMASVLNKGIVSPAIADRFFALPMAVNLELKDVFTGRIGTQRETGQTFREVMADASRTPDERSDYARHAFDELRQYQADKRNVLGELTTTSRDLDLAITKAIEIIPETNEAELLATTLIGNILDRIKAERERTAEGAQANERIAGGIQYIEAFNDLLRQPVPLASAMRGIANIVGRAGLTAARPGGEVLELIGERTGFDGGVFEYGTGQWIHALAAHLARLETPEGRRRINASQQIIESTLHALYRLGDARQALHEFQLADDGTLRRFRADYLEDLRSKVPRGFNTILRRYATAQVEADALTSAQRRLDRRIETLTTRKANLEQARDFLAEHERDPGFTDFGKAVVQHTGAEDVQLSRDGTTVVYAHPLTGKPVRIEETFKDGGSLENIRKIRDLAQAGLQYAAQPGSDPLRAAFWTDFAENIDNYLLAASPHYDVLTDPAWNIFKRINNLAPFIIAETQLSRIPGIGAARATRALRALGPAMKAKNAFQKDAENNLVAANIDAWKSHGDIASLQQWQDEVAGPMHDRRQHYGQNLYQVGDSISGYGHVITSEDMKAMKAQAKYDHVLVALHHRALSSAIAEAPQKIKIGKSVRRFALTRGPGTITRLIPQSTRDLPAQWFDAILRRPEERREGESEDEAGAAAAAERLDQFLGTGRNFYKIVTGHVLESERDYGQLGKGPLADDYKALRLDERELAREGRLPNNMADLSDWLARHHNEHLGENEAPITAADVRLELISDVSNYMRTLQENNKETANRAKVDVTSHENAFTQPREVKIVPGTLYEYGMADRIKITRMGNDAVEYYTVRWRDSLQELYDDLIRQKTNISNTLKELYGGESRKAVKQFTKAVLAGAHEDRLGRYQLTLEEVNRNIDRVGKMLQTSKELLRRREEFYGDDIANRLFSPTTSFFAGNVLLSPSTWILNGSSGSVMGALKIAEISRGGWLSAPFAVVKAHLRTVYKSILSRPPKNEQERIIQRLAADPVLQDGIIEMIGDSNREFQDRQLLRRSGVVDSFSYRDNLGLDRDLPLVRNLLNAIETIRSISAKPEPSLRKEIFSYLGVAPKAYTLLTRSIGMRWADNWINLQSTTLANGIAERLRLRSIKAFDNRLEHDQRFAELYRQYGDSFQRLSIALAGEGEGGFLTPSEITGRWGVTTNKAAVQLRRTFFGNNTPVDKLMLRYWWNQRATGGDRNAPFMTQAERSALQFAIAEDINMGTLATRSQWFASSRMRQYLGVLGQYWIWNTDKLSEIAAGVRSQKGYGRYILPAMAFLMAAGLVGLVSGQVSQQVTEKIYGTVSNKPAFWEATDDPQKLKIILSNMANYLGMLGSAAKLFMDTPGKLGYRNPIFLQNIAMDAMDTLAKTWQTGGDLNPTLDFFARYMPPLRLALNRSSMREGLTDVRNAANALRASTPESIEAKRRQPSSSSDFRATPMTPLYNAILNAAAVGDWASADESFAKAVEQSRAAGNPNPEQAIISAIRSRSPETAVYSRALTDGEREMVYGRLSPENRATVDRVNNVFQEIANRYGTSGGGGGTTLGFAGGVGSVGRIGASAGLLGDTGRLSLGAPRGVRYGFRSRSLRRGLRTRSLLRGGFRRQRVRSRLRRLTAI